MQLVATLLPLPDAEKAAAAVAGVTGTALAEARMRLSAEPPAMVARCDAERAAALVAALRGVGAAALALDERVPSDEDRTAARLVAFEASAATFLPRSGEPLSLAWPDVHLLLRGVRAWRSEDERTEKSRRFSLARAVATSGIALTRTEEATVRRVEESHEQVILVYARGGRAATVSAAEVDFSCLGPDMQPSSTANMAVLARRLREMARGAFYDERLLRLGRRPLPFVFGGESVAVTDSGVKRRVDTRRSLDVLAEAIRQGVVLGFLSREARAPGAGD